MIDRRSFICATASTLVAIPLRAYAERKQPRIGLLTPGPNPREPAFWEGMRDLGYVDGKTIVVERRSAEGDYARLPALAVEIVKGQPDVIVAIASTSAIAAKQATVRIPIVMVGVSDPVAAGLVGNLARPGGNVTGTSTQSSATVGKLLEIMRQMLPRARRVAAPITTAACRREGSRPPRARGWRGCRPRPWYPPRNGRAGRTPSR